MAGKTFRLPPIPSKAEVVPTKIDFKSGGADSDVSMEVSGLESLAQTLLGLPKFMRDAAGYEMAEIAHEIIEDAKENYAPVRFGNLKDSGDADEYDPRIAPAVTEIAMWFGAPLTESQTIEASRVFHTEGIKTVDTSKYALEQHENLQYHHTIGGAKYLELPLAKASPEVVPRIAKAVGIVLGGNGGGGAGSGGGGDYF